jgi:hypothetical protein
VDARLKDGLALNRINVLRHSVRPLQACGHPSPRFPPKKIISRTIDRLSNISLVPSSCSAPLNFAPS